MHTHANTHRQAHKYKKTPDEKQIEPDFQAKDVEKIVEIFYVVVVILKDLLAAGNNGLEYRLP